MSGENTLLQRDSMVQPQSEFFPIMPMILLRRSALSAVLTIPYLWCILGAIRSTLIKLTCLSLMTPFIWFRQGLLAPVISVNQDIHQNHRYGSFPLGFGA